MSSYHFQKVSRLESSPEHTFGEWGAVRSQLLLQWERIPENELDHAGPDNHRIALLIERKYGIACQQVENYLMNFERTMPLLAASQH